MSKGGFREGAGRKPGSLSKKTIERRRVEEAMRERILKHADKLLEAQLALAIGTTYIYRIDEFINENGKKEKKHVLVTDPEEITRVLDTNGLNNGLVDEKYYWVTAKDPNNFALESLFNRSIGKPVDRLDITTDEGFDVDDEQYLQAIGAAAKPDGEPDPGPTGGGESTPESSGPEEGSSNQGS